MRKLNHSAPLYVAGAWRDVWRPNRVVSGFGPIRHKDMVLVHVGVDVVFCEEETPFMDMADVPMELIFD